MYIWLTKPHPQAGECVLQWRNQQNLKDKCPITAVDSYYNEEEQQFWLFQGDESGQIRVQNLWACIDAVEPKLEPIDVSVNNPKRNAHREFEFRVETDGKSKEERKKFEEDDDGQRAKDTVPLLKEGQIQQVFSQQDAHSDVIRSIQYINVTDKPLIMTASLDRKVRIIDMQGADHGTLKQGY